jgi:FMN phosphatase YigB (HAD superfamily)
MIKAVFFDFDGVLTINPNKQHAICKNIENITSISYDIILACYEKYLYKLDIGCITHFEIWEDFCTNLGEEINISELNEILGNVPINIEMFKLAQKVKDKNLLLGIITNNTIERFNAISKKFELIRIFDSITLSSRTGCKKSENDLIFRRALDSLSVLPEESIFIDNTEKNFNLSGKMGFHTIYYDDVLNDIDLLMKNLSNINIKIK